MFHSRKMRERWRYENDRKSNNTATTDYHPYENDSKLLKIVVSTFTYYFTSKKFIYFNTFKYTYNVAWLVLLTKKNIVDGSFLYYTSLLYNQTS